jgi:hypothetical protein
MNLYLSVGSNVPTFALDVTVTETGLTYKTYRVFEITNLKQWWGTQVEQPILAPMNLPTPDETPVWTTDKYAVYKHASQLVFDAQAGQNIDMGEGSEQSLDFAYLQTLSDYSDHAIYPIFTPDSPQAMSFGPNANRLTVGKSVKVNIRNAVASTSHNKLNPFMNSALYGNGNMMAIIVPLADMPPSEWDIVFSVADESLIRINSQIQPQVLGDATLGKFVINNMPKVVFKNETATVDADGYVDLEFSLATAQGTPLDTAHEATVYLKTTAGSLNKQQVKTVNGQGKVRLIATHLESGDQATVSCGFQYYSGTDDCVVTVK